MRKHNFYAGPSTLPLPVLEELRETMVDYHDMGLSIIETSHRSNEYDDVHNAALSGLRGLLDVPETHDILLLGGGATMQFGMVPLNLLARGKHADMVISGAWAKKALADVKKIGSANVLFDGAEGSYSTLPAPDEVTPSDGASYLHITTNETIGGLQWKEFPETGSVPLVADMSSDILSRRIDVSRFGLIYAGAQKNLGPAGVTIVIVQKDLYDAIPDTLPAYLDYRTHAGKDSLYNTPPVFSIYGLSLVLNWITGEGGVDAIAKRNIRKAAEVYRVIESAPDFFTCPVDAPYRSDMNIVFRLPTENLEKEFLDRATEANMVGLEGHRSVGGIRASLYNALPLESAETLAKLMKAFAEEKG